MFSGLTPSSRQRKFCEGFLFFPIKHLRKHGNFIFRQYDRRSGVKALLDMKLNILDYNTGHAENIDRYISQRAMPQAGRVLANMEDFYTRIQAEATHVSGSLQDFNELFIHYYREVTVYHSVVLRNLKEELKPLLKPKKGEASLSEQGYDHIAKVYKLVKEFVLQSKTIVHLLDEVLVKEYNFPEISHQRQLMELQSDIKEMYFVQKNLCQLLKRWETDKNQHGLQTYYN
ncbi:hypothetical protein ACTJJ0_00275 [Chitinophaga sp. 22321]|uniref:CHAD domain-containing protein n=2 Tax=Chitinophaga hostae TaxID=2831022 RepID=A0ABS5IVM7_9BACT|nr:hypothetical protein [Chitinophaga hostae]MBS0027009.1 hypothetical protein [Chitinophaga hostae]